MKSWEEILEELNPRVFRTSALILELIERRKLSLDASFKTAVSRFVLKSGEARLAYKLASSALRTVGIAKWLLETRGLKTLPLRRRAAFYVAVAVKLNAPSALGKLVSVRGGLLSNRLLGVISGDIAEEISRRVEELPPSRRLSLKHSIPPLLADRLVSHMGESAAEKLAQSLSKRAVWLRAFSPDRQRELEGYLKSIGVRFYRDSEFSYAYRLDVPEDEPLPEVPQYLGVYQDKASMIVVEALVSKFEGSLVLDAAAAPCLKTQLLLARLPVPLSVAVDISSSRIATCKMFLSPLRARVDLIQADSSSFFLSREVDAVLLDAPCTNSGAISRDPGLRLALWSLTSEDLEKFKQLQISMLRRALDLLRRHGVLVYSTCSLLPEEGEDVISSSLDRVILTPPMTSLSPGYPGYEFSSYVGRAFPHIHRTGGFFIALMRKMR